MSMAKLATFAAALVLAVGSSASAQSAQGTLRAPHMTKAKLVVWCRNHPKAVADCKDVRNDNHGIRSDRKEVRTDRKDLKTDIKAGNKQDAKADRKDIKSDRKDLRRDSKDKRKDVKDIRQDAHR
jgi:hypothetical protein